MIVFDTETTGLVRSMDLPLKDQPYIIELAAIKLDDTTLEETGRLEFKAKPPIMLPPEITKITGLTDADLVDAQPFAAHVQDLTDFWRGESTSVAHNHAFDRDMMTVELMRLSRAMRFPWTSTHICTVERSFHYEGHRLKLGELYARLVGEGKAHESAHRAMNDVEALVSCVREMRRLGDL